MISKRSVKEEILSKIILKYAGLDLRLEVVRTKIVKEILRRLQQSE